jgi:hypothetical protein
VVEEPGHLPPGQTLQANGGGNFSMPIYEPGYNRFEYGPSPFDHTNVFVASYVWKIAPLDNAPWYLKQTIGGWQWTGIISAESGDPLTIYAGKDQSLTNGNDRAIVAGQPYSSKPCKIVSPCKSWFNTASFSLPLPAATTPAAIYATYPFRFGNASKGGLRGPGFLTGTWDSTRTFLCGNN